MARIRSRWVSNPARPITFDLTTDLPDNRVFDSAGNLIRHIGALERNEAGGAILRAFGDMKRHDMMPELAESIDEAETGDLRLHDRKYVGGAEAGKFGHHAGICGVVRW